MAGFRVLQLLPGVGPATAARVLDEVAAAGSMRALAQAPPPRAAKGWQELLQFFGEIGHEARGWPAELTALRDWYAPHLERLHEDAAVRTADLVQLEQIAAGYATRQAFLTELTLDPPEATSDALAWGTKATLRPSCALGRLTALTLKL